MRPGRDGAVAHQSFALTNVVANRALIPILRSRAGRRLGRRLAVVDYDGRRSGVHHQLVTQYATEDGAVRITVAMAERKTWWRNFNDAHPVRLRLAGKNYDATARVVREGSRISVVATLDGDGQQLSPRSSEVGNWSHRLNEEHEGPRGLRSAHHVPRASGEIPQGGNCHHRLGHTRQVDSPLL